MKRIVSMSKKRKAQASGLEEVERSLYSSFSAAAVSVSTLYTQAQSQQKLAFRAGELHAVEKLHQFISRQSNGCAYVSVEQLLAYLQREVDESGGSGTAFDPSKGSGSEGHDVHLSSPQRRSVGAFAAALIAPSYAGSVHGGVGGEGAHATGGAEAGGSGGGGVQGLENGTYGTHFALQSSRVRRQVSGPHPQIFCTYEGGVGGGQPPDSSWNGGGDEDEEDGVRDVDENMDTWTR